MAHKCYNCGAILPEGAKLCGNCGKIVSKNSALRPEPVQVRRQQRSVVTQSREFAHKPTPTAVMEVMEDEEPVTPRPKKKRPAGTAAAKKTRKKDNKAKFIVSFTVLLIVLLMLLYLLIFILKVHGAKGITYESDTGAKMSYSTYGEAAEHFFGDASWDYSLLKGEVSVSGSNKGSDYKYIFKDDKVVKVIVGTDEIEDEKQIDILVQRMFL